MVKKNDLSCVFTPATGDAYIADKQGRPVVQGHGLKTSEGGLLDKAFGVKPGDSYYGTASIPGVGDPAAATAKFEVFKMNAQEMGCSVPELGISAVPAVTQSVPKASAPAPKAP